MKLLEVNNNFREVIFKSKGLLLVDFWADWCGTCKILSPLIMEVLEKREDISLLMVNVEENEEIASAFNIQSVPTLILFNNGKSIKRESGGKTKEQVINFVNSQLR